MRRTCLLLIALVMAVVASCAPPSSAHPTPSPAVTQSSLDIQGSGNQKTAIFTVSKDWFVGWSYQCQTSCTFAITVKKPDGSTSVENQPFSHTEAVGQGVLMFHTGGKFYLDIQICCATNAWTIKAGDVSPA